MTGFEASNLFIINEGCTMTAESLFQELYNII